LIDLTLNDLTYTWETKAKDSGSWELISTSEVLLLYQKLVGNVMRLSSKAVGKSLFLSLLLNSGYISLLVVIDGQCTCVYFQFHDVIIYFFTGVETVFSNVIGPVIDDKDTNILLSRAVPIEYGYTRLMCYNILAGE